MAAKSKKSVINKKNLRWLSTAAAAVLVLFLWWVTRMADGAVYSEIYVPAGQNTFTAREDVLTGIGIRCEDYEYAEFLFKNQVGLTIGIYAADGSAVWEEELDGNYLKTDGFTYYGEELAEGVPVCLTPGEEYSVYLGMQENTRRVVHLKNLSLMLYGERQSMLPLYLVVLGTCGLMLLAAVGMLYGRKLRALSAALAFLCMGALLTVVFPVRAVQGEENGFAAAYLLSSSLLGGVETDETGHVYIEEDALRSPEETDNAQALYRFWTEREYGSERMPVEQGRLASAFSEPDGAVWKAAAFLPALGIALARAIGAPWQIVYLSGKLAMLLVGAGLFGIFTAVVRRYGEDAFLLGSALFLLLSVPLLTSSYVWYGTVICLVLAAGTILLLVGGGRLRRCGVSMRRTVPGVLLGAGALFLVLALLYDKADMLLRGLLGTWVYGSSDVIHTGITYGLLAALVLIWLRAEKKRTEGARALFVLQMVLTAAAVIDAFSYVVRQ